jgi:lysophospholipase L1-like esterase
VKYAWISTSLAVIVLTAPASAPGAEPLKLADGDRVVFVGNTFVERDQTHGYLETLLTARFPDKNIIFRNLGWSGDTVFGDAWAAFDPVPEGFKRLREHVLALKPTLMIVGYGMNESFAGEAGLERFVKGLNTLLDALKPAGAKTILVGPIRHEDMGRPLPDPSSHNSTLKLYNDAIARVAAERKYQFIDLFDALPARPYARPEERLTDNGIHLTSYGYWNAAQVVAKALGLEPVPWKVTLDRGGMVELALGTKLTKIEPRGNGLRFVANDETMPLRWLWRPGV